MKERSDRASARQRRVIKWSIAAVAIFCLGLLPGAFAGPVPAQQKAVKERPPAGAPADTSADASAAIQAFLNDVKEYIKLREQIEDKLPKLSDEAEPAEIKAHQEAFAVHLQAARAGAKPGDLFKPEIARHIRLQIKDEFKGERLKELRSTVLNSDAKGIQLKINHRYPETKEKIEMAPTLLLRLPQLPPELRYRFNGRHLLLVDRRAGLIIDYMLNALP